MIEDFASKTNAMMAPCRGGKMTPAAPASFGSVRLSAALVLAAASMASICLLSFHARYLGPASAAASCLAAEERSSSAPPGGGGGDDGTAPPPPPRLLVYVPFQERDLSRVARNVERWRSTWPCALSGGGDNATMRTAEGRAGGAAGGDAVEADLWLVTDGPAAALASPDLLRALRRRAVRSCFGEILVIGWMCDMEADVGHLFGVRDDGPRGAAAGSDAATARRDARYERKEKEDAPKDREERNPHYWCSGQLFYDIALGNIRDAMSGMRYPRRGSPVTRVAESHLEDVYGQSEGSARRRRRRRHDYALQMESDMVPIQPLWLDRLTREARSMASRSPPLWASGNTERTGNLQRVNPAETEWFLNGNALHALRDDAFAAFLRGARRERGLNKPFDVALWEEMRRLKGRGNYSYFFRSSDLFWPATGRCASMRDVPEGTFFVHTKGWTWKDSC